MLFRKGWGALVSFGVMAYLARKLDQQDFGIVAISATLINMVQVVAISGISEYLIFYKGTDENKVINAGFWLNLMATLLVSLVVLIACPYWTSFYGDERIGNIILLFVIGFFFSMISAIPIALFRKNLNYKPIILIQTVFGTFSSICQFGFAYYGFGVYSLALPNAIITPVMAISLFWRSGFFPRLELGLPYWKNIIQYTKHVIGQRILGKLANEGDTLIIGKFFGMQVLGVYNLANQFANLFTGHFLPIITDISAPIFAKNNNDRALVILHYHKMIRLITFVTVPVIMFLILNAEFLVITLYGEKWIEAVLPFQILSVFVLFRSIGSPTAGLYNAMGKPQIGLYFAMVFTPIFLSTIYVSSLYGNLILLVVLISVFRVLGSITHLILAAKLLQEKLKRVICIMIPVFASTGIAFLSVLYIPSHHVIYIVLRGLIFIIVTFFFLRYIGRKQFNLFGRDILTLLPPRFQKFVPISN